MAKRKVIFLDTWTKGIRMFIPIVRALKENGIESLLIHRGSWGKEPDRPDEEIIEGVLCRDIRYYKTNYLCNVLKKEQPDWIILLTTNRIVDRAEILAARALGIKSIFLMHGIVTTEDDQIEKEQKIARESIRSKILNRMKLYLFRVIPNYFASGLLYDKHFLFLTEPYMVIWNTFRHPEKWLLFPEPSPQINCDRGFVWADIYVEFYHRQYGYPKDSLKVIGHPPLDSANKLKKNPPSLQDKSLFLEKYNIPNDIKLCVYLEGAFVTHGFEGWTESSMIAHLNEVRDACARSSHHLVIKLHPNTSIEGQVKEYYSNHHDVTITKDVDLDMLLYLSNAVISHSSTTINTALFFDKPVFVPMWGISSNLPDNFVKNGGAIGCSSKAELLAHLLNPESAVACNSKKLESFKRRFISYFEDSSTDRILRYMLELVE